MCGIVGGAARYSLAWAYLSRRPLDLVSSTSSARRYLTKLTSKVSGMKPFYAQGTVIKGFGRGSKELGIPTGCIESRRSHKCTFHFLSWSTANFPEEVVEGLRSDVSTGVYYGWAKVDDGPVYKMVMSIGWNPYYKNEKKSMETHILHEFDSDFYGSWLRVIVCGYRRPEKNYKSLGEYEQVSIWSGIMPSSMVARWL